MKLSYPAIFYPWEDGEGFTAEIPDLPGCATEGDTLADAFFMAQDAASGWILSELENGKTPPAARRISELKPENGGIISFVALDLESYSKKYGETA